MSVQVRNGVEDHSPTPLTPEVESEISVRLSDDGGFPHVMGEGLLSAEGVEAAKEPLGADGGAAQDIWPTRVIVGAAMIITVSWVVFLGVLTWLLARLIHFS
jgi:hypothetical protein